MAMHMVTSFTSHVSFGSQDIGASFTKHRGRTDVTWMQYRGPKYLGLLLVEVTLAQVVPEYAPNRPRVYLDIAIDAIPIGRIAAGLHTDSQSLWGKIHATCRHAKQSVRSASFSMTWCHEQLKIFVLGSARRSVTSVSFLVASSSTSHLVHDVALGMNTWFAFRLVMHRQPGHGQTRQHSDASIGFVS